MSIIGNIELRRVYDGIVGSKEGEANGEEESEANGGGETGI
jgi:hypothetical protein